VWCLWGLFPYGRSFSILNGNAIIEGMKHRERNQEMLRLVLEGRSCREVGEMFGLTKQRVLQIVKQLDPDAPKKSGRRRMQQRYSSQT
jgi:transposase